MTTRPDTRAFKRRTSTADVSKIAEVSQALSTTGNALSPPLPAIATPTPIGLAPAQVASAAVTTFHHLQVGAHVDIHPGIAKPNPYNARRVRSQTRLDDLAIKLRKEGQLVSALAYINEEGEICLIDGHRRQEACRIAGILFRVEIRPAPKDNKELYRLSRSANKNRDEQTPLDDALAWRALLEASVYASQIELCEEEGLNPTTVSRTLALADMPKTIIGILADRPELMNLRMMDAINRYYKAAEESTEDTDQAVNLTEQLILEIEKDGLSSRDVDNRRSALQRGPVSRKRSMSLTSSYKSGESTLKRFAGQGRLVLEVSKVADEERVALLERRFNEVMQEVLGAKE